MTFNIEPLYVIDTHVLIWYLVDAQKLSEKATLVFEAAERGETSLIISAIVLAEMYYANKKYGWFADFSSTYLQLKSRPYFRFVPLLPDHIFDFAKDEAVPEMHDRIIVGLARRIDAPLLTIDPQIKKTTLVSVVW
ncbi:MAG: PIN domain-containing protein [Caldilineaceae bacterium]